MLYNEATLVWTPYMIRIFRDAIRQVVVFFARNMEQILEGLKPHELQHHLKGLEIRPAMIAVRGNQR